MKKDALVFIGHMLDEITKIENSVKGLSKADFKRDVDVQDAMIRRIEIIGEAAKNLSSGFRIKHKEVPWSKITGTRDKLIHHYFGVDLDLTWEIVKKDLPVLKKKIESILLEREQRDLGQQKGNK